MYERNSDWPKIFWKSYIDDNVDPSSSMVNLINNILIGRMELDIFKQEIDTSETFNIHGQDIKSVLEGASFIRKEDLAENSIKAGDLFEKSENSRNYLLNIRADCDCIPREGKEIDSVELYCIEGKSMSPEEIRASFIKEYGNFKGASKSSYCFLVSTAGRSSGFTLESLSKRNFLN